jgi:hypothetical protein
MYKNKYETNIISKSTCEAPVSPTFASTWVNPVFYMVSMLIFQFSVCFLHLLVCVLYHNPIAFVSGLPILAYP